MANATFPVTTIYLVRSHNAVVYHDCEYSRTVREAIDKANDRLLGPPSTPTVGAMIYEAITHTVTTIDGAHKALELRFRLAAQLWRREDGRVDGRVYQASESPWGSTLP